MFRSKRPASPFSVDIARDALESIFDDCDKFDADETGGRLLGTYRKINDCIEISVTGVLEAGPSAQRSPTFFLQDGNYQEQLFRAIEEAHPDVEHLGNWHTHHVNGLQTLSGGDKQLYNKIVTHQQHNTDFFYALLVTRKNARRSPRYDIKHFLFCRNDPQIYELSNSSVTVTDKPLLRPKPLSPAQSPLGHASRTPNAERAQDKHFFDDFYPDIRPLLSRTTGMPYWKGSISLIDGSLATVIALEQDDGGEHAYAISVSCDNPSVVDVPATFKERQFASARHAVIALERELNRAIFLGSAARS